MLSTNTGNEVKDAARKLIRERNAENRKALCETLKKASLNATGEVCEEARTFLKQALETFPDCRGDGARDSGPLAGPSTIPSYLARISAHYRPPEHIIDRNAESTEEQDERVCPNHSGNSFGNFIFVNLFAWT